MAKIKSNDNIPADELVLAEALAAAGAVGATGCTGAPFLSSAGIKTSEIEKYPQAVCAVGAIALAARGRSGSGYAVAEKYLRERGIIDDDYDTSEVYMAHDGDEEWSHAERDYGASLGWAFRQAMRG